MLNPDPFKYVLAIMPRRSGKDLCALNICLKIALREMSGIYYVFPTYSQAKKVIWDAISSEGKRLIDYYFPDEVVKSRNSSDLKITFKNGSFLQFCGSDNYDSLRGTNPKLIIYSEAAFQDPQAFSVMRPILAAQPKGQCLFITTPNGKNWFWDLYNIASDNPEWFVYKLTLDDTHHISDEQMELERKQVSYDMIQQEYFCNFELGVEGAYYTRYLHKMRLEGRIGQVPYEINHKVHCCFDLGMADSTVIIWFQTIGNTIRIIDCYENSGQGLEHYAKVLQNKPYEVYGKYIAPHDIAVRELGTGMSRLEKARQLGIPFTVAPKLDIVDGIEAVRTTFSRMWIDEEKCEPLIKALENYRHEYDQKRKVYKNTPLHDFSSHFCFVGETLIKTDNGDKRIDAIKIGDNVLTPFGIRQVLNVDSRLTNETLLIETKTSSIECTKDHDIFTQKGIVKSDSIRYSDVLESYGRIRNKIWKKILQYFSKEYATDGFKKIISSQKMNHKSSLMDIIIDGMENIIKAESQTNQGITINQPSNVQCGNIIMDQSRKGMSFTIKTEILKIIKSKTWNVLKKVNILVIMPIYQTVGRVLKPVKTFFAHKIERLLNGILAKRVKGGIRNMLKNLYLMLLVSNILKFAIYVKRTILHFMPGKSSVLISVKQKVEYLKRLILWIVLVVYVKLYSIVINTLLRRHVVRSVQLKQHDIPVKVYDLTIDVDHCYYANGYLVSNSDAMRYLCISLPKTNDQRSPEDWEKLKRDYYYGESSVPNVFDDRINQKHW